MAENATVARPYAEALFRVAQAGKESFNLAAWSELVAELAQIAAHPEVQAFARNPKASASDIVAAFKALVKTPVSPEANNFLTMLVETAVSVCCRKSARNSWRLKNAAEGAADAVITSAFELDAEQVSTLIATLEKKFSRKLHPVVSVDPALIGGVRVVVGDEVLDTSVRAKLQQMRVALVA